jgi:hypothetical protein
METDLNRGQWGRYLAQFSLLHVAAYVVVGSSVLAFQDVLVPADLVAIDFFEPYRIAVWSVLVEGLRGLVLAAVFYPFYRLAATVIRGWWVLFLPLWGLTVVGSIDPWLGSIEGVIYTEITPAAHLFFLGASAVQYGLLVGGLRWMARRRPIGTSQPNWLRDDVPSPGSLAFWGYLGRFVLVYVGAYLVAGIAFFVIHDYGTIIPESEAFALWRPLDHPYVQLAILFQVGRGALLGLLLFPLYGWFFGDDHGWLRLFGVFWGGIYLGTPAAVHNLVDDVLAPGPLTDLLFGTAELTIQLLGFALVFWVWESRRRSHPGIVGRLLRPGTGDRPAR